MKLKGTQVEVEQQLDVLKERLQGNVLQHYKSTFYLVVDITVLWSSHDTNLDGVAVFHYRKVKCYDDANQPILEGITHTRHVSEIFDKVIVRNSLMDRFYDTGLSF